jgi:hypothetical protein
VSHISGKSYTESTIYVNQKIGWARADKWREDYQQVNFSPMTLKVQETDLYKFHVPPDKMLEAKHLTSEATKKYQILWNAEHESWIFPYRDPYTNELWGWQEKNNRIFRNYPAGTRKSRTLFGFSNLTNDSPALLVESPVDVAIAYASGVSGAVSSFGIPTGSYQLSLIQHRTNRVILALDSDTPGRRGTASLISFAIKMFDSVRIFNYSHTDAKDIGEMSQEEIRWGYDNALLDQRWLRNYKED